MMIGQLYFQLFLLSQIFSLISSYRVVFTDSVASLQQAIYNFQPFDDIVLANGLYNNCNLKVSAAYDITIRSEKDGGVIFSGSVSISIAGSRIIFRGFQFIDGNSPKDIISVSSSYSLFTQLNFYGFNANKYINFEAGSQYNVISYSNFEAKPANAPSNNLVGVLLDGVNPAFHIIQYCSFRNMLGNGGDNGNEPIRLGSGSMSTFSSSSIVEFCLFENTSLGDSESISVKSKDNILRYNTFTNQQGAMLCFRNGNNNYAYGNFFINAGGIRVKQASNIWIYNNYFYNSGLKDKTSKTNTIIMDDVSTYSNPDQYQQNVSVLFNTIVNGNGINLGTTSKSGGLWSDNIFQGNKIEIFVAGSIGQISFFDNQYSGTLGVSIPSGMISSNTLDLNLNSYGYYSLSSGSSARKAGTKKYIGTIPPIPDVEADYSLSLDIAECDRPVKKDLDIGCNQFKCTLSTTTINRPLTVNDVGPIYKRAIVTNNRKKHLKKSK